MNDCTDHYAEILAPVYEWAGGGFDAAVARGAAEIAAVVPESGHGAVAVDLGAGFGMHAVPLARRGWRVVAIDTSPLLLARLREHGDALGVRVVEDDLLNFPAHLEGAVDLAVCMGDTLTHLASPGDVETLADRLAAALKPGGRFVASFRDYSVPRTGSDRFVLVNADPSRILTCVLEYLPGSVLVQDVVHERAAHGWNMRVGAYRKLRLAPGWLSGVLESRGFSVRAEAGLSGMQRLVATKR